MPRHRSSSGLAFLFPAALPGGVISTRPPRSSARPWSTWARALVLAAAACGPATAEQSLSPVKVVATKAMVAEERCAEAPLHVTAATSSERSLVCSAAESALQLLGRCDISPRRPFRAQITNEIRHPFGDAVFGYFDSKHERVVIRPLETFWSLAQGTPFGELPPHDLYKSIIVHEIVHAVMHQSMNRPATNEAAYEYPAYALQIESLPPDVRSTFLRSLGDRGNGGGFLFNDFILQADPFLFAARAYAHFKASPDGCARLRSLLEGDVPFILTAR